jgi:hypothetical protein
VPGELTTHLVISEIMYHAPAPEGDDAAYVEVLNTHPTLPLDLTGVQFTTGIGFTFDPGTSLAPGARLLVVKNAAVFAAKYGANHPVAGEFSGNLAQGGERLTLSLGGGSPLRDFEYDDAVPWPATADGEGASLILIAPQSNPDHGNPLNWRASIAPNPGATDTESYATWKSSTGQSSDLADTDGDGLTALEEYALGGNPAVPSTAVLPVLVVQPDGQAVLRFTHPLARDDVGWSIEVANELITWRPDALPLLDRRVQAGLETLDFALPAATAADPRRWWRLRFWVR